MSQIGCTANLACVEVFMSLMLHPVSACYGQLSWLCVSIYMVDTELESNSVMVDHIGHDRALGRSFTERLLTSTNQLYSRLHVFMMASCGLSEMSISREDSLIEGRKSAL